MEKRIIKFSPPDISEAEISEVAEALRSGWITTGPRTKLLERRLAAYIETGKNDVDVDSEIERWSNRVVCLNSATASAAIHCGAKVVFVDIKKDGDSVTHAPEMDYQKLEEAINENTKAIIAVDIAGIVCDYKKIYEIVEKKKELFTPSLSDGTALSDISSRIQHSLGRIAVVSDCAHGLGASRIYDGKELYAGTIADFTSFSFHAVKNFTTAEGGAATWKSIDGIDNAEIYKFYQLLSLHGQSKDALAKTQVGAWEYDILGAWYKCNMTDIMASIGLRQLDRYPSLLHKRKSIILKYDDMCDSANVSHLNHYTSDINSSGHLYLTRIPNIDYKDRNSIITKLAELGVNTNVHYKPLPMMSAYKSMGWDIIKFPNSYNYYSNLISLPLHSLLSNEDVEYVCEYFKKVINELRG